MGLVPLMMVTPGGGVKVKSASVVGMFSWMLVKVKLVEEPSAWSMRMDWIWPVASTVRAMEWMDCCMPFGLPDNV